MKLRSILPPALIASLLALTALGRDADNAVKTTNAPASAAACPTGGCCLMLSAATPAPAHPEACVVSGDKLGEMGKPVEYLYKQAGKPDRVIQLCCKDCIADFEKSPAKYLAKLDAAEAAAAKAKK